MTLYHTFCIQLRRASGVWHINPGTPLSTPITKRLQRQPAADFSTNVVNTTPRAARVKAGNQSTTAATSLWPDAFEPRMPKLTRKLLSQPQPSPPRPPRHRSPSTVRADRHHHSGQFASKRSTLSLSLSLSSIRPSSGRQSHTARKPTPLPLILEAVCTLPAWPHSNWSTTRAAGTRPTHLLRQWCWYLDLGLWTRDARNRYLQLGDTIATHTVGGRHELASEAANHNMKPLTDDLLGRFAAVSSGTSWAQPFSFW